MEKICTKCRVVKPLDSFFNSRNGPQGKGYWCKACQAEKNKAWAANNPQKKVEYSARNSAKRLAMREELLKQEREARVECSDSYVAGILATSLKICPPELIALKRDHILMGRARRALMAEVKNLVQSPEVSGLMWNKFCTICRQEKPSADFPKSARANDGLAYKCKACNAIQTAAWQKENIERRQAYYADNKERIKAYKAEWERKRRERMALAGEKVVRRPYSQRPEATKVTGDERACKKCQALFSGRACQACQRSSHAKWIASNPEKVRAYRAKHYENYKEDIKEDSRRRYREKAERNKGDVNGGASLSKGSALTHYSQSI